MEAGPVEPKWVGGPCWCCAGAAVLPLGGVGDAVVVGAAGEQVALLRLLIGINERIRKWERNIDKSITNCKN